MTQPDPAREAAVVVGVDGSERNQAALDWAVDEAARSGLDLLLVSVASPAALPLPPWTAETPLQYGVDETTALLDRVRRRVLPRWDRVAVDVRSGNPSRELVAALVPGDELVVGRRGIGPAPRAVLGSTSIESAGRSAVATVIVPDDWDQRAHDGRPLVAGVDGTERDLPVLDFAFDRAAALGVTLVVVAAWEAPPLYAREPAGNSGWTAEAEALLADRLRPWTERHGGVDVACYAPPKEPSAALLEDARDAQLVVLGRFEGVHHLGGFSGFSTCRRVLHHAVCPVAIVPVPTPVSP